MKTPIPVSASASVPAPASLPERTAIAARRLLRRFRNSLAHPVPPVRSLALTLTLSLSLSSALTPAASAGQHQLRYEWAATPDGPFTPVPPGMIKVHPDGTATVVISDTDNRAYYRVLFDTGAGGGGTAAPSVPVLPLNALPRETLERLNLFITTIGKDDSPEGADWKGASIAPFVTPVVSIWNETGSPDLVELKILGKCEEPGPGEIFSGTEGRRRSRDRGFILASLNRQSPPVIGYSTEGITPCESVLANCQAKPVRCIRRFGPMFLAAEDADGNLLGHEGLFPVVFPDDAYKVSSAPVSYEWDSEKKENPTLPEPPPRFEPLSFAGYPQLREALRSSPVLNARRRQREALIEFDWKVLDGTAPKFEVIAGQSKTFLETQSFTSFAMDEDDARIASVSLSGAGPGVTVRGLSPGACRLTLYPASGDPHRYLIVVRSSGIAPRGGGETGVFTSTAVWEAGTSSDQPRFDQRSDLDRWCDAVGCGPAMLAIQLAWAEHNQNVPSAYWNRAPGASLNSRRDSLREINSPMTYVEGSPAGSMVFWYDYFHDLCNVACWANGAGSTLPWDCGDALGDYVDFACSSLMPLLVANDGGGPLVGGRWAWTNDSWGDDWDEAGVKVANAIKAGRPGGVYYMEHWHYCVAWRYRKNVTQVKVNGEVITSWSERLFRVNTGWGNQDRVWNAYDIDGCFLMNLWQKRTLP